MRLVELMRVHAGAGELARYHNGTCHVEGRLMSVYGTWRALISHGLFREWRDVSDIFLTCSFDMLLMFAIQSKQVRG